MRRASGGSRVWAGALAEYAFVPGLSRGVQANVRLSNKESAFVVGKAGASKASPYLQFVAEDDSRWIGTRNDDGFFVTRVAGQGEDASNARLAELATWLDQTSHEFMPGALLAKQLATATAN